MNRYDRTNTPLATIATALSDRMRILFVVTLFVAAAVGLVLPQPHWLALQQQTDTQCHDNGCVHAGSAEHVCVHSQLPASASGSFSLERQRWITEGRRWG